VFESGSHRLRRLSQAGQEVVDWPITACSNVRKMIAYISMGNFRFGRRVLLIYIYVAGTGRATSFKTLNKGQEDAHVGGGRDRFVCRFQQSLM